MKTDSVFYHMIQIFPQLLLDLIAQPSNYASLQERVARLNLSQIETLGEALWDFQGLADLEQWLACYEQK